MPNRLFLHILHTLFLCLCRHKEKVSQKESAVMGGVAPPPHRLLKKAGENFYGLRAERFSFSVEIPVFRLWRKLRLDAEEGIL